MEDHIEQLNPFVSNMEEIRHNHEQWSDLAQKGARKNCVRVVNWKNKLETRRLIAFCLFYKLLFGCRPRLSIKNNGKN